MEVNEHKRRLHYLYTCIVIKANEQLVVRNDMDVNEHERLPTFTLRQRLK